MKRRFLTAIITLLLGSLAQLSATSAAPWQSDSSTPTDPLQGDWLFQFELFQGLLEQSGLEPVQSIPEVFQDPKQSVVVLTGEISRTFSPRLMEHFCHQGGSLLVACDTGFSAGRIAEFERGPVVVRGSRNRYQDFEDCLVVSDFPTQHPTTRGVQQLIFNRTGWLKKPRWFLPAWQELATLPTNVSPSNSRSQPVILQVKTLDRTQGRMLVTADHSLFTNGMLWHGDNALFAIQVAEWLAEGDRKRLLFISDGETLAGFLNSPSLQTPQSQPPNMPIPEMDLATMLKFYTTFANKVVQESQQQNLTNELLANQPRNMRPSKYRQLLLIAFACLVAAFAVWRFTATNYNYFTAMPKRNMKSALALNHEDLSRQEELSRAASMLARDLCRELTGSTDSRVWSQQLSEQSLSGRVNALEKSERARLGTIVDLATNKRTVPVSKKRLEELGKMIHDFRMQHRDLPVVTG